MYMNYPILMVLMIFSFSHKVLSDDNIRSVEFTHTPAPNTIKEHATTYTKSSVIVTYGDGSIKRYPLKYNKLFSVKDKINNNQYAAGQLYTSDGSAILDPFNKPVIAETPDGNSLLNISGRIYLVTHYEYDWLLSDGSQARNASGWFSRMPMSMTLSTVVQENDLLRVIKQRPIDFSSVGGLHIPCFASQTPWNTHLGSEENYDIDARRVESNKDYSISSFDELYFKNKKSANPYYYGVIPEVIVNSNGSTRVIKHHAMGRATWEMAKVMGDERTVYFGSDGANQPLIMFIASKQQDLSQGTLYAAKWRQSKVSKNGVGRISWIKLGTANDQEIRRLADKTKFSDIFSWADHAKSGHKPILANSNRIEYLKLNKNNRLAAAFLETIRYSAIRKATTEFNKMEGIAINEKDRKVYIAISRIAGGMLKTINSPVDDIQLPEVKSGAIYELNLRAGQKDSDGNHIDSKYVATTMQVLLSGKDIVEDSLGNKSALDKISNPDNIFYSEKMRILFIGEDSRYHINNFLWAYHIDTGKLSRILSTTAGAEVTGLQVVENMNGYSYIMSNIQHPGDLILTMDDELRIKVAPLIDRFDAQVGYISGVPIL